MRRQSKSLLVVVALSFSARLLPRSRGGLGGAAALRFCVGLALVLATAASADGRIHGAVIDVATNRSVPRVRVVLRGSGLKTPITALTNERGYFLLTAPPGDYVLRAEAEGSQLLQRTVRIFEGATVRADAELCPPLVNCDPIFLPSPSVDVSSSAVRADLSSFLPVRGAAPAPSRGLVVPRSD